MCLLQGFLLDLQAASDLRSRLILDPGVFSGGKSGSRDSLLETWNVWPCERFYTAEHLTYPHLQRESGLQTTSLQWYVVPFMGCATVSLFIQEPEELSLEELEDRVLLQKVLVKLAGKPLRLSESLISYG